MLVPEGGRPSVLRRPGRRRSIRMRIAALLVIPLISLIALWAFAASVTLGAALNRYAISDSYDRISVPGIAVALHLQGERSLSTVYRSTKGLRGGAELQAQRARSDAAIAMLRRAAQEDINEAAGPRLREMLTELLRRLEGLEALRAKVDGHQIKPVDIIAGYGEFIEAALRMYSSQRVDDAEIYQLGQGLQEISWAREYMTREDSLVTALQATGGRLTAEERGVLMEWAAQRQLMFDQGLAHLDGSLLTTIEEYAKQPDYQRFLAMEQALLESPAGRLPPALDAWSQTVPAVLATLNEAVTKAGADLERRSEEVGDQIMLRLVAAGGVGLLAVIASVVLSVLVGRGLVRELRGLRRAADDLADNRLPEVVERLRRGEEVDIEEAAPPLRAGRTAEVAQVASAFTKVQRTAVETAVSEAHLRKGISRVFLNLAWRSQSLLHRQLRMLETLQRKVTDPDLLEELFRIDHLTTRMRRHAEGLIILSGAAPGRGWSRPVPLEDVLRSAAAEVEDYTRVEVVASTPASLSGAVVADVVHLLAELIENATVFSPPPTEVLVRGEMVANGYAVEVIDRGIGIDPRERADLNQRLAEPPEFDLADSDRLGLFVVSRLAARHGIKVALQESVYGGTCAVVLLPPDLIADTALPPGDTVPAALDGPSSLRASEPQRRDLEGPGRPQEAAPAEPERIEPPAWSWFEPHRGGASSANGSAEHPHRPRQGDGSPVADGPRQQNGQERPAPLPRRIRQANLVPELRSVGPVDAEPPGADPPRDRSAEQSRDLLASLQGGWLRGRAEDEDGSDDRAAEGGES
ncbi:nitrate- and nitrite sensing domain-containing protein [Thermomonospora sp. CIF 1]|uniref:sensor histidine kinase n=1 Tax=Thermomonospora sp. CIF 1 TaxID=1916083 RepID=UPI000B30C04C|nr:nitrate- and nitrite sensing domain-containing protein [Thermomonospora sp. CIF 1]PKK13080.1 MAG: sensor [Thermomonospora sp. CIF 1]